MNTQMQEVEPNGMTYRQILRMVERQKELILTVADEDVDDLKRGVTRLRSRDNTKLKDAGLEISEETLSYTELPCNIQGFRRIQMRLSAKRAIKVQSIELPDDTI